MTLWAELASTGGLGALMFFAMDLKDIGQITWIVGALLVAHRYLISSNVRQAQRPVRGDISELQTDVVDLRREVTSLGTYLNLRSDAGAVEEMRTAVDSFFAVNQPELRWLRDEALEKFQADMSLLQQRKRSRVLYTADYYAWLLPEIKEAVPGSEIWAVSRMMDCEWDDSPEELEFLRLNLDAAGRGVRVTRLFLCQSDVWMNARQDLKSIQEQLAHGGELHVYFGDLASIQRRDAAILTAIGDGLIAFDRRALLVDQHSEDGTARGYVSANQNEIRSMRHNFDRLKNLCTRQHGI